MTELLSRNEAAALLGVDVNYLSKLVSDGKIEAKTITKTQPPHKRGALVFTRKSITDRLDARLARLKRELDDCTRLITAAKA